ncbi:MAG: DUF4186 domain-containing protein [Xanthomonadaceae bacterium]|nr:DUF4186 domain-containing protein [Xanthomonadaceae bacterium]
MRNLPALFTVLERSTFRSRFHLHEGEREQLKNKGIELILLEGRQFLETRLAPKSPKNDGSQTPMKGHPIFIAQHATGSCCRGCLAKWHGIAPGEALSPAEIEYLLSVLRNWLERQNVPFDPIQPSLF